MYLSKKYGGGGVEAGGSEADTLTYLRQNVSSCTKQCASSTTNMVDISQITIHYFIKV